MISSKLVFHDGVIIKLSFSPSWIKEAEELIIATLGIPYIPFSIELLDRHELNNRLRASSILSIEILNKSYYY